MATLTEIIDSLINASYDTGYYAGQKRDDPILRSAIGNRSYYRERILAILQNEIGLDLQFDIPCPDCGSDLGHYPNCPYGICTIKTT